MTLTLTQKNFVKVFEIFEMFYLRGSDFLIIWKAVEIFLALNLKIIFIIVKRTTLCKKFIFKKSYFFIIIFTLILLYVFTTVIRTSNLFSCLKFTVFIIIIVA